MAQLRPHYPAIKKAGGEVLLVSFYPPDRTRNWARRFELPFKLASDTTRDVYKLYGLGRIMGMDASTVTSVMEGLKGFIKMGAKIPEHMQHADQLGGYFAVDREGIVVYSHPCLSAVDNPSLDELLTVMQVAPGGEAS